MDFIRYADKRIRPHDRRIIKEADQMSSKLDLMDWKNVERNATATMTDNKISLVISEILLKQAQKEIKALGGKTLEEEDAEIKKNASNEEAGVHLG